MNRLKDISIHRIVFNLLIIFLPIQLGYHFWPPWSMVLGRRIDYLSPTLFFTDILIFSCLIVWFLIQKQKFTKLRFFINQHRIQLRVGLFFIFINIFLSVQTFQSLYGWLKGIELFLLGFYIVKTKINISELFPFISIAAIYSSLLGIIQTIYQGSIGGILWFLGERSFSLSTPSIATGIFCIPGSYSCVSYLRPYATFSHPNVLAGFLTIYLILALQQFLASSVHIYAHKKTSYKFFIILALVLSTFTLLLTHSRSAWLALGITGIYMYFKKTQFKNWGIPMLFVLFVFCFSILLSPLPFFDNESIDVRLTLNQAAITIIQRFPIFGTGLHTFLTVLPQYLPLRTIYFLQPVHNIYLLALSEIGISGLLVLAWIIRKNRPKLSPSLLAIIFVGLFDHYLLTIQQGQLILVLVTALSFL